MLNIYLTRHGQDEDNANNILNGRRDLPLTAIGIAQANELAHKIREHKISFDHAYTSPLIRTRQTAKIILDIAGGDKLDVLQGLIERDFGVMTGVDISEIASRCAPDIIKTEIITYFLHPEGAETFPELIGRAKLLLAEVKSRHRNGNILLVTHGDIGKMIYAAYYNLDWREVLTQFHFGNSELLLLSPESDAESAHVFMVPQYNM